jgi:hypothetical protein
MLTQASVRELFKYTRDGKLLRKVSVSGNAMKGDVAGCLSSDSYLYTNICGDRYANHRLIWLYHHGYLPENDIDHIDRDPSNNRINNLREVSRQCNLRNTGNRVNNTSGVKGVYWAKTRGKWMAYITIDRKQIGLGYYEDFVDAVCARLAGEQCIGWEGCDSNSPAYKYKEVYVFKLKEQKE